MSETFDVCVVGAGAGGAVAAWALVHRGMRVVLLETGRRFPVSSFHTHARGWELDDPPFVAAMPEAARETYESDPGERLDAGFAHLASRSPTTHSVPRTHRLPFFCSRAFGVGGSTLHYQGEAHRFPAHAFRMKSERGVADDWPITYVDLEPYYERVERLLGVAGDPENPFKPKRGPYPYPAHPLSPASRRIAAGARELGLRLLPNSLAILPSARPGRAPCHYCNGCSRGCDVGAKGSVDVAVLPDAEATGRLTLLTGMHATHLEHGKDRRISAVVARDELGTEHRFRARAFVLAAGAIETPRLLLCSAGGAHPSGVGNDGGVVGRYLMELLYVMIGAVFERSLQTYAGVPLDSRIWDGNGAVHPRLPNGFVLGQLCGAFEGPGGYAIDAAEGFGMAHRAAMRSTFGAGIHFLGVAEQLPRPENRVSLSEKRDRWGMPLARVTTHVDGNDLRALSVMHQQLNELASASGVVRVVSQVSAYDVSNATHVAGTCRMGKDPAHSVVDEWCRVHGVGNLVIADASVLTTQGAGDSPSLTLQALALRAAEALIERGIRLDG